METIKIPDDLEQDWNNTIESLKTVKDENSRRVLGQIRYYLERIATREHYSEKFKSENKRLRTALTNCALELNYIHDMGGDGFMTQPWKPSFLKVVDTLLNKGESK